VKEHPIIFTAEMVRAILDGRKTQTRRCGDRWAKVRPGDRMWVKETWCWCWKCARLNDPEWYHSHDEDDPSIQLDKCGVKYAADSNNAFETCDPMNPKTRKEEFKWQPSIFMPRWASRITLEVVGNRSERVHDISREDCIAEGCPSQDWYRVNGGPEKWFMVLWCNINGKKPGRSWADNPLVHAIEFKRVKP